MLGPSAYHNKNGRLGTWAGATLRLTYSVSLYPVVLKDSVHYPIFRNLHRREHPPQPGHGSIDIFCKDHRSTNFLL